MQAGTIRTVAAIALLASSIAQAADVVGVPRIVDGDTLAISVAKIRTPGN